MSVQDPDACGTKALLEVPMIPWNALSVSEKSLVGRYRGDPGTVYDMSAQELQTLLGLVGEEEPVIDAILKNSGASKRQRAEAIGIREEDFDYEDGEGENFPILVMDDLGR